MSLTTLVLATVTAIGVFTNRWVLKHGGPRPAPRLAMFTKTVVIFALLHWVIYFRVLGWGDTVWADPVYLARTLALGVPLLLLAAVTDSFAFTLWMTKHKSD